MEVSPPDRGPFPPAPLTEAAGGLREIHANTTGKSASCTALGQREHDGRPGNEVDPFGFCSPREARRLSPSGSQGRAPQMCLWVTKGHRVFGGGTWHVASMAGLMAITPNEADLLGRASGAVAAHHAGVGEDDSGRATCSLLTRQPALNCQNPKQNCPTVPLPFRQNPEDEV